MVGIMSPEHPRWKEFLRKLEEKIGHAPMYDHCLNDFGSARKILAEMGWEDVESTINFFQRNKVYCDCEILKLWKK